MPPKIKQKILLKRFQHQAGANRLMISAKMAIHYDGTWFYWTCHCGHRNKFKREDMSNVVSTVGYPGIIDICEKCFMESSIALEALKLEKNRYDRKARR
jgi:phage terminase large subunit GpA-like protein